jgi:hypothetical protein
MGNPQRLMMACVALMLTVGLPSRASAAMITFTTVLDGVQETPATNTSAFGYGQMGWDEFKSEFHWSIYFQGLTTPATAAHFHFGPPGVAGPVVLPIPGVTGLRGALIMGNAVLPTTFLDQLLAGDIYVNIHSETYPGGEIRGQVTVLPKVVPEPATMLLVGGGLLALSRHVMRSRKAQAQRAAQEGNARA